MLLLEALLKVVFFFLLMTAAYFKDASHHISERDTLRYKKNRKSQYFIGKNKEKKSHFKLFLLH